jgi:hypothetical protein
MFANKYSALETRLSSFNDKTVRLRYPHVPPDNFTHLTVLANFVV